MVKILLSHGASPIKIGGEGKTPIEIAYSKGYSDILRALIEAESRMFN